MMNRSFRSWLELHPNAVQIVFPYDYELSQVRERLARAEISFHWLMENVIAVPPGSSIIFTDLRWILTPIERRFLEMYSAAS